MVKAMAGCDCGKHKNKAGCQGAKVIIAWRKAHPEEQRELSRQAGLANAVIHRMDVLERYIGLDRDDAIYQAWKDGGHRARERMRARYGLTNDKKLTVANKLTPVLRLAKPHA